VQSLEFKPQYQKESGNEIPPVIPALRRLRQESHEYQASLSQKKKKRKKE
jgi:hypothetical protein